MTDRTPREHTPDDRTQQHGGPAPARGRTPGAPDPRQSTFPLPGDPAARTAPGASAAPGTADPAAPPAAGPRGTGPPTPGAGTAPDAPTGVDLARVALRAAKEQARARGDLAQQKKQARRGGLRSGARADGRDPVPLGSAISRLITDRAWEAPAAVGGVMGRWPQIVGEDLAHHCTPLSYDDEPDQRVLTVQCDSTAWATQVRLLAPQLLARLNQDLGQGTVRRIKVQGPHTSVRRYGPLRAPGSRGPGDTYG
jgi:predicted nucleic acid-binding Zn ribbon protein